MTAGSGSHPVRRRTGASRGRGGLSTPGRGAKLEVEDNPREARGETMKIAILGAGGVGGYYAGVLARAGHEVVLLARGAHLEALRARGLEVRTPEGSFNVPVRA